MSLKLGRECVKDDKLEVARSTSETGPVWIQQDQFDGNIQSSNADSSSWVEGLGTSSGARSVVGWLPHCTAA